MGGRGANYSSNWETFEGDKLNGAKTVDGIELKTTKHGVQQMLDRGVTVFDVIQAVKKPLKITEIKYDGKGRPSKNYIGEKATASVNPTNGNLVTMHPTHKKLAEKLRKGAGENGI